MTTIPARPRPEEYDGYYDTYISEVTEGDLLETLGALRDGTAALLAGLTKAQADYRYAEGKWSLKEVICHVADAERIFSYRALRIARGDEMPLASFDEDIYVRTSGCSRRTLPDLARELRTVREATLALFASLDEAAWMRVGTASNKRISVRALGYIIAGHERHHIRVVRERYLAAGAGV
jgi:DinB superfamily